MKEVIEVVTEFVDDNSSGSAFVNHMLDESAHSVLEEIARSSFRTLLIPYYTKILVFQSGIKAKVMCECYLKTSSR
jgi:hypothetical protein